jgi:hypothetical protein
VLRRELFLSIVEVMPDALFRWRSGSRCDDRRESGIYCRM